MSTIASLTRHSAEYERSLFENAHRFVIGYNPSNEDILKLYIRSTGVYERRFNTGDLDLRIVDPGGARANRKNWVHVFDRTDVMVIVVDITCWSRTLFEDRNANEMRESIQLADSLLKSRFFETSTRIVAFTNIKHLQEALVARPLEQYYEDYTGGDNPLLAMKFFETMLTSFSDDMSTRENIHFLYTDYEISPTQPAEKLIDKIREVHRGNKRQVGQITSNVSEQ